jgi:uncharacterized protein YggE
VVGNDLGENFLFLLQPKNFSRYLLDNSPLGSGDGRKCVPAAIGKSGSLQQEKAMKAILATLVVFLGTTIASADITVTGNGKITFVPDLAHVSVGVSSDGRIAVDAWKANAEIVKRLFQVLKDYSIDSKDMKTAGLNVSPKYVTPHGKQPQLVGYTVTYNLELTVRRLDRLGKVLDALVANGANRGMNISFSFSKLDTLVDQARAKAVSDARHKAELYVHGAGAHVGAVVAIAEGTGWQPMRIYYEKAAVGADLPVTPGQQEFTATVTVTYTIENG